MTALPPEPRQPLRVRPRTGSRTGRWPSPRPARGNCWPDQRRGAGHAPLRPDHDRVVQGNLAQREMRLPVHQIRPGSVAAAGSSMPQWAVIGWPGHRADLPGSVVANRKREIHDRRAGSGKLVRAFRAQVFYRIIMVVQNLYGKRIDLPLGWLPVEKVLKGPAPSLRDETAERGGNHRRHQRWPFDRSCCAHQILHFYRA